MGIIPNFFTMPRTRRSLVRRSRRNRRSRRVCASGSTRRRSVRRMRQKKKGGCQYTCSYKIEGLDGSCIVDNGVLKSKSVNYNPYKDLITVLETKSGLTPGTFSLYKKSDGKQINEEAVIKMDTEKKIIFSLIQTLLTLSAISEVLFEKIVGRGGHHYSNYTLLFSNHTTLTIQRREQDSESDNNVQVYTIQNPECQKTHLNAEVEKLEKLIQQLSTLLDDIKNQLKIEQSREDIIKHYNDEVKNWSVEQQKKREQPYRESVTQFKEQMKLLENQIQQKYNLKRQLECLKKRTDKQKNTLIDHILNIQKYKQTLKEIQVQYESNQEEWDAIENTYKEKRRTSRNEKDGQLDALRLKELKATKEIQAKLDQAIKQKNEAELQKTTASEKLTPGQRDALVIYLEQNNEDSLNKVLTTINEKLKFTVRNVINDILIAL